MPPSPATALGVFLAALASWRFNYANPNALCLSAIVSASLAIAW